jgi:hypothetical protein
MTQITKVQSFAGAQNQCFINFGALSGAFPGNVAHGWMVYFRETSGDSGAFQYLGAKCDQTGLGQRIFTDSNGGAARYGLESNGTTSPNRATTSVYTQAQWHCFFGVYDGSGVAGTDIKIYHSINGGSFVEATYSATNDGSGSIATDAADSFMIGNRPTSLDRAFKGRLGYLAHFDLTGTPITSAAEVQAIFDNGPLSDSRCDFLWANGQDYVGGKTPTSTGSGDTDDTVNLPPNIELGDASEDVDVTCQLGQVEIAGFNVEVVINNTIEVTCQLGQVEISGYAATVQHGVPTTIEADFAGANANLSTSTVTNPTSSTPLVTIFVRSPDDAEWQQHQYKLVGVANKTVKNRVKLTGKEDDPDAYLGTYQGPWWSADPSAGPEGWTLCSWTQVSGDYIEFDIEPGANDTIYVASLPPQNEVTVLAWIQELAAAHPTLVHDDVPSSVAFGGDPYVCALSGSGADENGRSITNRPLYAFRIGNDSLGTFPKRIVELWSGVHSGEWNGLLQLRGFASVLFDPAYSDDLLSRFDFVVRPLHSIKGNYLGFRRNEAAASIVNHADANREWADGDTTLATVVQWQGILDFDYGVTHSDNVFGFFDFHDGKNVSQKAWMYQYDSQPNIAEWAALVDAENSDINAADLTGTNGTTQQYWVNKGVPFAWTCELADEKSTVAEVMAFGEAYARALIGADDAGMLGEPSNNVVANCQLGQIEISGYQVTVQVAESVDCQLGQVEVSGLPATVNIGDLINLQLGSVEIAGFALEVEQAVSIQLALGSVQISGFPIIVVHGESEFTPKANRFVLVPPRNNLVRA